MLLARRAQVSRLNHKLINGVAIGPAGSRFGLGLGSGSGLGPTLTIGFRASCVASVSRYEIQAIHECACADIAHSALPAGPIAT